MVLRQIMLERSTMYFGLPF